MRACVCDSYRWWYGVCSRIICPWVWTCSGLCPVCVWLCSSPASGTSSPPQSTPHTPAPSSTAYASSLLQVTRTAGYVCTDSKVGSFHCWLNFLPWLPSGCESRWPAAASREEKDKGRKRCWRRPIGLSTCKPWAFTYKLSKTAGLFNAILVIQCFVLSFHMMLMHVCFFSCVRSSSQVKA